MVNKCESCGRDLTFLNKALWGKDKDRLCRFCIANEAKSKFNDLMNENNKKKRTYPSIIKDAIMERGVYFKGGHSSMSEPVNGSLAIIQNNESYKLLFKVNVSKSFEIPFESIKDIEIVDDNYTPGIARTILVGNTASQSMGKHKSVFKVTFNTGKRDKSLEFEFGGDSLTWKTAVADCQEFYSKVNSMLD